MMNIITIGPFPIRTPSLNVVLRTHYSKRRKDDFKIFLIMQAWINRSAHKAALTKPIKKNATFVSSRRRRCDLDNIVGGFKWIRDCLTKLKVFVDDSPEWLEATYKQVIGEDAFWIEIET